ncbi:MAG TPA: Gldg family protein [Aliidongia sp.]|uniref:GldG family protein n=1 Tax=Aliidongia sp. TaxID=1914230 RepID=UPI002DDCD648|nr:Gldg family protein [Aliidongia sp.]HEV2672965.1 Gldg family protein [Aliidongia sp.]
MSRSATGMTLAGLGLAAVLLISVNALSGKLLGGDRFDLTDQSLYTLSDGTKAVLAKIDEPVTLKLFYSKELGDQVPSFGVFAQRVRELLQEYAADAHGKINLQILDPQPYSEVEDQATAAGLQGVPLDEGGEQVYFGLAGSNSTDDKQNIAFFQPDRERFLEYDLTKLIQQLAFPKKKVIGLVSSLSLDGDPMARMQGQPTQSQVVLDQLRQGFDVRDVSTSFDKVPDDIDLLMVVQPQKLPAKTEYAIDQFVMKGGHALVFADPSSEFAQAHPSMLSPPGSGPSTASFDRLLKAWGVELVPGKVVGDRLAARKVNAGTGTRVQAAEYLAWLNLKGDQINHDDPVTGQLGQLNFATAGALRPIKEAKTKFEWLVRSSAQAELIDTAKVQGLPDVLGLLAGFKATGERYTLAARITGPADTAFPDGKPVDEKPEEAKPDPSKAADAPKPDAPKFAADPNQVKTAQEPINVIVVADSDLLDDRFWVQVQDFFGQRAATPTANNGDLVQNAVDSLAGTGDLIGLRSRGSAVRPFTVVDQLQRQAEDSYRAKEKELQDKLRETQTKLSELRTTKGPDGKEVPLTAEQQQSINDLSSTIIQTRQQLRQVQLALRQDIDRLKGLLVGLDVALVPIAIALLALVIGMVRAQRRKRRAHAV